MMRVIPRRDQQGVAAVIAEILLVAMSVTLAATVFYVASNLTTQASVSNRPYVAFGAATLRDGTATIPVISVSRNVAAQEYKVNLEVGSAYGTPVYLAAAGTPATVTVAGVAYEVTWQDVSGAHVLTGGDPITIAAAAGPLPSGLYSFFLIWSDGSVVQSTAWSV